MDKTFKQRLEILPIKNIEHPVGNTKYYAAVHVKTLIAQADEEFQELKSKIDWLNNLLDERNEEVLEKVRKMNEALPVVPECVGLRISEDIEHNTVVEDILTIIITSDDKDLKEYGLWIKKNPVTYVIARTLGYQVEKPQLFYLKNKLTRKYLRKSKHTKDDWNEDFDRVETVNNKTKFTQQEINSMQTGSYEQIEVTE